MSHYASTFKPMLLKQLLELRLLNKSRHGDKNHIRDFVEVIVRISMKSKGWNIADPFDNWWIGYFDVKNLDTYIHLNFGSIRKI